MPDDRNHTDVRDAVARLCADFPGQYWRDKDRQKQYPVEFVEALTEGGYLSVLIPEEYGGAGMDIAAACAILEEIQRSGANSGACHAQMYTMGTLLRHGSDAQKRQYLPDIAGGKLRLQAFGVTEPSAPEALPVITFGDSVSIHFNGEEIRAIHLPHGHTDGDAVVYFSGSNVVHMGDDFFAGRFPFVDLSTGGSVQGLVVAVRSVLEQLPPDVKIIPGHGPLSGREDLQVYLEMVEESLELVSAGIEAGKSLKELQGAGMPDRWADWGGGFIDSDRWIEILYESLQGS
ncbi:MAG: acyl-CoA dehydrogenase family protein [Proteobacteria bacterium]|nr:acyl-CoA dehydrogenase family protein [Pseudomonadota bacterium]